MKFKPNGSWVVLPDPTITETESGIILDEATSIANAKRSNLLEVQATGPMCTFAKIGDTVMVDPRTEAVKARIEDKDYLIEVEGTRKIATKELQVFLSFICSRIDISKHIEEFNRQSQTCVIHIEDGKARIKLNEKD